MVRFHAHPLTMEKKRSPRRLNEVDRRDRVEIFSDIVLQMDRILAPQTEISNPLKIDSTEPENTRTWIIPNTDYFITRDLKMDLLKVVIGRVNMDNLMGERREEIRIIVGRPQASVSEPDFEYYKKSGGQRRRNLRSNSLGTIAAVEKFFREMEKNLT